MPKKTRGKSSSQTASERPSAPQNAPASNESATTSSETPPASSPKSIRPLIAQQSTPADVQPRTARRATRDEPREWFARLRIREDRLARLWVANLTSRDVVVWSPKEKRWVALLGVPELRNALKIAEQERAANPRSVVSRPPSIPPTRLSQPPTQLPPSPPPPIPRTTSVSIAGELRLLSIAQGTTRSTPETSRASVLPAAPPVPSHRRLNEAWAEHFARKTQPANRRFQRWPWKALERVLWVAAGVGLVLALSGVGSADETSNGLAPATFVVTADLNRESSYSRTNTDSFARWFEAPQQRTLLDPPVGRTTTNVNEGRQSDTLTTPQAQNEPGEGASSTKPRTKAAVFPRSAGESNPVPPKELKEPQDFDLPTARIALINAVANAKGCPGSGVQGKVIVTFDPSGFARAVDIPLLIGDGVDRDCIARVFKSVRVPVFTGGAVAVKKDF